MTLPSVEGDVVSDGITLESSILSDMERIQLELRRIETSGQASLEELVESKRATKQGSWSLFGFAHGVLEHRYIDTIKCGSLGLEVPGHSPEQVTQTLIVLCTHLCSMIHI